ncbi:hypothetical protein [Gorillibacterium massiliense]|uniref:hypothetical protein n=1 Tax=Gorillibacterium massiliense TaxID=1280390 RepID=UPI0004B12845|nr:hypothetical protein [Gorillibacterium massiliense]
MARPYRRFTNWDYTVYGLSIFGFMLMIFHNILGILVGVAVIAVIVGLFYYERRLSGRGGYPGRRNVNRFSAGAKPRQAKRKSPFRVIPGNKPNDKQ